MSELASEIPETRQANAATRLAKARPHIPLPDGDFLEPRRQWAAGIGITDRSAQKLNLPTTYVGNVAYVKHDARLRVIAERVRRRNEPPAKRRGRR